MPEDLVVIAVDPLGPVDRSALERRDDLAAGEHHAGDAELAVDLSPRGIDAIPLPLNVREGADFFLEPPHRLGPFGVDLEADHVHLQALLVGLVEEIMAASLPVPPVVVDEVHAEEGTVRQGDECLQFADDVARRGVSGVQHAPAHRVLDLEGRHDRAGRRQLYLEPPAGGLLDCLHQQFRSVLDDRRRRPGALHLPLDRGLGLGLSLGWNGRIVRAGVEGEEGDDERERHRKPQGDHLAHIHPSCETTG